MCCRDDSTKKRYFARHPRPPRLKDAFAGPDARLGIPLQIQEISGEVLRVDEGSLYPAPHRMEREGWIAAEWGLSENNRRARFYRLTATGRKQQATEERNWRQLTEAVARVLKFAGGRA
jgi:PadR family transcriptional regulator